MPASDSRTPKKVDVRMPVSPLPPLAAAMGAGVVAYLIAESALAQRVHPLHWGMALVGGVAGFVIGYVVAFAMRG